MNGEKENKKRRAKKHVIQSQPRNYIQHQSLLGLIAPNMYNVNYVCTAAVIRDFHIATEDPWPIFLSNIALFVCFQIAASFSFNPKIMIPIHAFTP